MSLETIEYVFFTHEAAEKFKHLLTEAAIVYTEQTEPIQQALVEATDALLDKLA